MANANQLQVYAADVMQFHSLAVQACMLMAVDDVYDSHCECSLKELAHVAKFLCCFTIVCIVCCKSGSDADDWCKRVSDVGPLCVQASRADLVTKQLLPCKVKQSLQRTGRVSGQKVPRRQWPVWSPRAPQLGSGL